MDLTYRLDRLSIGFPYAIWGTAEAIWVVGDGWIARSTGSSFTAPVTLYGIWGSGPNDIWAVGKAGTIMHGTAVNTTWQWQTIHSDATSVDLYGIWGSGPNDIWVVGQKGVILHGDGAGWASVASDVTTSLNAVWGIGATDVWAVGNNGVTLRWH